MSSVRPDTFAWSRPRPGGPSAEVELLATDRTLVMGILNVTPDSFSDGDLYATTDAAIAQGRRLLAEGADIIDVGGESTRPGATPVPPEEEQRRVLPVIAALAGDGAWVSVDTLHASTARAATEAGARIINDVSGGLHDPEIRRVAAESGAIYIASHWRGIPDPEHRRSAYADVVAEVRAELADLAAAAIEAGVDPERLVLDPGLGFDKTAEQGWQLLAGLPRLAELGPPILVGASRKRMIAEALGHARAAERLVERDLATAVVSALAAGAGAWAVRVHAVSPTIDALAVAEAWQGGAAQPAAEPEPRAMDRITLTGLEVFAHHGVFDFEREQGQRFLIDAELTLDLRDAAGGDDLARTVHYGELAEAIVAAVSQDPVDLIETVAERVAEVALSFAGVAEARITVHKPDAPIDATFADVAVSVTRRPAPGRARARGGDA